jgi:L-ribulose-5-phosphate 4-epimerase
MAASSTDPATTASCAVDQAGRAIPCLGTTHADHFAGPVPVTRQLTPAEIAGADEESIGAVILEAVADMARSTLALNPSAAIPKELSSKHFRRKHGPDAYCGQPG